MKIITTIEQVNKALFLPVICLFLILLAPLHGAKTVYSADSPATNKSSSSGKTINLSASERAWLLQHKTIRVAFDGYFPPYSFLNDDGQLEGLAVDVMQILAERIGITIEVSPKTVWKDLYEAAQKREVDVVATMGHQPEREEWFVFTQPYIFKSLVIMTSADNTAINRPEDLAGKQVALVRSYQYVKPLLEKYPSIKPLYVDTMLDGLNAVAVDKADAVITFLGAGHYLKAKYQIANLKFAAVFERDRFTDSIAVRKDWPELASIFDKALDTITGDERAELDQRWVGPEDVIGIAPRTVFKYLAIVAGFVISLVLVFTIWNRALKREVTRKTSELQKELAERREIEAVLKESERYNRALFEQSPIGLALCRMDGHFVDVNPAYASIIGRTVEETLTLNYWDITPKKYANQEQSQLDSLRENGRYGPYEKEYIHKDGHLVLVRLQELLIDRGGQQRIWSSVEDISERKQAEDKLVRNEKVLRLFVEHSPAAIAMFDRNMHYIVASRRFLKDYNIGEKNVIGRSHYEIFPEIPERWKEIHRRCLAGAIEKSEEDPFPRADGKMDWVRWEIRPWHEKEGEIGGIILFSEVITERKGVEDELRITNEEMRTINRVVTMTTAAFSGVKEILEKVLDEALKITGLEGGTICMVNSDEALELAAHRETSKATIIDLTTNEVKVGDCLCGECARDHNPLILWNREAVLKYATREATRGEDIRFHAAFPLIIGDRCLGVLCVFTRTDTKPAERRLKLLETITAQIAIAVDNAQMFEEISQHAAILENKVKERTAELQNSQTALLNIVDDLNLKTKELEQANAKLKDIDRLKSIFIASMSHELRTPLNSVIGFSSILMDEWLGPVNVQQKENLQSILKSGRHLLSLINDVIDVSKIEAGKVESISEEFDLYDVVKEALSLVEKDVLDKELELNPEIQHIAMHSDRRRLFQCIANLLSNAVKFTEQGTVRITARRIQKPGSGIQNNDEVSYDGYGEISVEDTGIGISEEDMPKLFHPFVRIDSPLKKKVPGTGLGLYLTKKLVNEVLKGEIRAESIPGTGSRFILRIPLKI